MSFIHLHNHTHYSLLDGLSRPKELARIAKEQGSPAIAMTDHGVMYGAIEFYKACKEEGINPIIGCEIYVAPAGRLRKEPGLPINHLTVLASTNEGYQNLIQLVSKAHLEGFYYKPRVDHGLLHEFRRGLIVLSGCLASEVSEAVLAGRLEQAAEIIKKYRELFGSESFFLEVQDHAQMQQQILLNQELFRLGIALNVPVVATNDSHYARKEDREAHDILLCIQTGKTVSDVNRMKYEGDFSIRPPQEIVQAFEAHPEAIANTVEIANRCKVDISFRQNLIPRFKPPEEKAPADYLRELCEEGLRARYGTEIPQETRDRFEYELEVIHNAEFDTYFLIVQDVVRQAKERGVIVGPGRGSAAGSLIAYVLGITDIDPLKYGLLFERFLNPARVSMPDIDIDFDDERRDEVLAYVVEKYGRDNVAQIITFGTMAARAVVRDVGRAMGYPYDEVDRLAKLIPPPVQGRHIPLATSMKEDQLLHKTYEADPRARNLLDKAIRLEGTVRHAGTHACAVVIGDDKLIRYTPLQRATGDGKGVITQFSMKPLEELGLLKVDFLGLKNLTIIRNTLAAIEHTTGISLSLSAISLDDTKTFHLMAHGDTTGVFQLESAGMRRYLKELKPTAFSDIIAMVSLYRPGPMSWIPMFMKGKHDPASVKYLHPSFEPILKETNGVAVYQEQILKLAREFAGFSLAQADILRKAVGKKDPKLLAGEKEKFISGAVALGHKKAFAEEVFKEVIEPFATYGFNKSHATCYAMIAYQTAYLKAHFPSQFMAALMTADSSNEDRIALEVSECHTMGIEVLPPSVNESRADFTVCDDGKNIRFGLSAIKGIGDHPIAILLEAREKQGTFTSLENFFRRVPAAILNKKLIECLAYSGALDALGERKAIAASVDEIVQFARSVQREVSQSQTDIFGLMGDSMSDQLMRQFHLKKVAPATKTEQLQWEKEFLGLFVSGHPLQGLRRYLAKKAFLIATLNEQQLGKTGTLCGFLSRVNRIVTKNGASMAYCQLEDVTGHIELLVFPRIFTETMGVLTEGQIVMVEGRFDKRNDTLQCIVSKVREVSLDSMIANAKKEGLFDEHEKFVAVTQRRENEAVFTIRLTDKMDAYAMDYLKKLLAANRGPCKVQIKLNMDNAEKTIVLPFGIELTRELRERIAEIAK